MMGLLIKDFYNLKGQLLIVAGMMVLYGGIAIANDNVGMFGAILAMIAATLPISAAAYDEKVNWDSYAMTMPISRGDLVRVKYYFGAICIIIAVVIFVLFSLVVVQTSLNDIFFWTFLASMVVLTFHAVIMPVIVVMGAEKSRMVMLIVFLAPIGIGYLLNKMGVTIQLESITRWHMMLISVIGLALWAGSIKASEMLSYRK